MPASPIRPEAIAVVLAVSDEVGELALAAATLSSRHHLITATSAEEARAVIGRRPDLAVVLAARSAKLDGARLLGEVRSLHPACRRVLVVRGPASAERAGPEPGRQELIDAINACRPHHVAHGWPAADALLALVDDLGAWSRRGCAQPASGRDPDTGLYTQAGFQERLREELARARRYGKPLSLLRGGIDDLAALGADRAPAVGLGDARLRWIAEMLSSPDHPSRLRESDVAGRVASGEIAILLPETSKEGAAVKAERLRAAVERAALTGEPLARMSIGIAGFPDDAGEPVDLLRCAEQALSAARAAGCNCVRMSIGSGEGALEGGRRRVALDPDDLAVLRRERFATYHVRLFDIVSALRRDHSLACLLVDLSELRRVEREVGPTQHADLFTRAGELLEEMRGDRLGAGDLICRTEDQDGYLCFLASPRHLSGGATDLEGLASRVEAILERELGAAATALSRELPRIGVGLSRVLDNPLVRPERLLARLVADANRSAVLHRERASQRHKTLLQEIILRRRLHAVYQPIVDLESGSVFGFEGLARGPSDSALESPTALFSVAAQVDLTFELDRACFRSALAGAVGLEPIHRLFLNLLPTSFYDSSFIEREVSTLLEAAALTPANVVFEITEGLAIEDFNSFRRALACYTRAGFGVAIDDVGTRHSNLESVMALRPHFLKLSDVLIRGLSTSTVKREMVRSLQRIAEAIDAVIVAEGIERPEDLAVLCDLGVRYGQGYLLARPGPPFPEVHHPGRRRAVRGSTPGELPVAMPALAAPWSIGDEPGADGGSSTGARGRRRAISASDGFPDEETTSGGR